MYRRPPIPPLFPYTTLSRSWPAGPFRESRGRGVKMVPDSRLILPAFGEIKIGAAREMKTAEGRAHQPVRGQQVRQAGGRSEEHTSELQSRLHLVCRLLLEKN